jgi:UDP-glucose 6-dehydrogenase
MKVVIFGKGKVGIATDLTLKTKADFHDPPKGFEVKDFSKYDLAIICVSSLNNGPTDHEALDNCLEVLQEKEFKGLVAIRCTVSPLFLRIAKKLYKDLKIIHFPEFMRQQDDNYLETPWVLVLGGEKEYTEPFGEWLLQRGYGTRDMLLPCTLDESALIKLHQNAGLALKVTYANIMYEVCKYYGANYETVRKGVAADVRVGPGHLQVPGEDGFGFSGHCLPKDLECLNHAAFNRGFWDMIINVNEQLKKKNV